MKRKSIPLLIIIIIFLTSPIILIAQSGSSIYYWHTTYDYPDANIMTDDLVIAKYYGLGKAIFVVSESKVEPIVSSDALSRYLTILHNGNGESSLFEDENSGNVAQFSTVINQLRNEGKINDTLVISTGDHIKAGKLYSASKGIFEAQTMNLIGYDVSGIGNMDFNFGPEGFETLVKETTFPFVSSNFFIDQYTNLNKYSNKDIFRAVVIERAGRNIGIVGATTKSLKYISSPGNVATTLTVRKYLQEAVNTLKERGLNVIIAVLHLDSFEDELEIASKIDGVDVFIAGGGNKLLGNEHNEYIVRNGVPDKPEREYPIFINTPSGDPAYLVSTKDSFDYVGRLTILFDENGVSKTVDINKSGPIPVKKNITPDKKVVDNIIAPLNKEIDNLKTKILGKTTTELNSSVIQNGSTETALGNAICDALLYASRTEVGKRKKDSMKLDVDFAIINSGSIAEGMIIPAESNITEQDTINLLPKPYYATMITNLTPQILKSVFEKALWVLPDANNSFLQVSNGIVVEYDTSKPSGSRVVSMKLKNYRNLGELIIYTNGTFISQDVPINIATTSFMAYESEYDVLKTISRKNKINLPFSYQDAFNTYIKSNSPISPIIENRLIKTN